MHLKISSLVASPMARLSRNISTNETEEFLYIIFNSDSKEICTMSLAQNLHIGTDIVATDKTW
jgi:hypothetical protein